MSKSRNIADLLDTNGDVKLDHLDNVPPADVVNDTTPQLGGNLDTQTYTVDGRDVSVDGTKLDGIEAGATADQTKADIEALVIDVTDAQIAALTASKLTGAFKNDPSTRSEYYEFIKGYNG